MPDARFPDRLRRHSVANRGTSDRVHLVIDAVVNDWVAALFEHAARDRAA